MKKIRGFAAHELLIVVLWLGGILGWILNIIKIVGTADDPIAGMFILRCIGIFVAPLGAVLGYF